MSELSQGNSNISSDVPNVRLCPSAISDKFIVKEYRIDRLRPDRPYQHREAVIEAKSLNYQEVSEILKESLKQCVVIKEIKYSREGGFDIEASKYSQY